MDAKREKKEGSTAIFEQMMLNDGDEIVRIDGNEKDVFRRIGQNIFRVSVSDNKYTQINYDSLIRMLGSGEVFLPARERTAIKRMSSTLADHFGCTTVTSHSCVLFLQRNDKLPIAPTNVPHTHLRKQKNLLTATPEERIAWAELLLRSVEPNTVAVVFPPDAKRRTAWQLLNGEEISLVPEPNNKN